MTEQFLRFRRVALLPQQHGQVVERNSEDGVVGLQAPSVNGQGGAKQPLRFRCIALLAPQRTEMIQRSVRHRRSYWVRPMKLKFGNSLEFVNDQMIEKMMQMTNTPTAVAIMGVVPSTA